MLSTSDFLERLKVESYSGNSLDAVLTALAVLTGDKSGLNGILPGLLNLDDSLGLKLNGLAARAQHAISRLKTLFEFEPRFNGNEATMWLLSIYARSHPELLGRGDLSHRMVLRVYADGGMDAHRLSEIQEYCSQVGYLIRRELTMVSLERVADTEHPIDASGNERQTPPSESRTVLASVQPSFSDSNIGRIIMARFDFDEAFEHVFKPTEHIVGSNERAVLRLSEPVSSVSDLMMSLGFLAVLAIDYGLKASVLKQVLIANDSERNLKLFDRILEE
ncbi:MAG: hypothetical protein JWO59_1476 [Chloroflexi bacterium]|nr:hypothetical protein [Chloroflexota bacterium]